MTTTRTKMKRRKTRFGSPGLWNEMGLGWEEAWLRYVLLIRPKWEFGEEPLLVDLPVGIGYKWKS